MAAPKRRFVTFDGFAGGEHGLAVPVETGAPVSGLWTGRNMAVLSDRSICPCPVPKPAPTTMPALAGTVSEMGMGWSVGHKVWFKAGDKVYQSAVPSSPAGGYTFAELTGTCGEDAAWSDRCTVGTFTYGVDGSRLERIDHAAGSVAEIAGAPDCSVVAQYGTRLMLGRNVTQTNRLYYSDDADPSTWPADNYIDIGEAGTRIMALIPLRNSLLIAMAAGNDTSWWVLSGTLNLNHVVRRAGSFLTPPHTRGWAPLDDGNLAYPAPVATSEGTRGMPAFFNGSVGATGPDFAELVYSTTETYRVGVAPGDVLMWNRPTALMRRNGLWSVLDWTDESLAGSADDATVTLGGRSVAVDPTGTRFLFLDQEATEIREWSPSIARPVFAADSYGAAPPASECFFTLPEWAASADELVAVRSVRVEFTKWGTGSADDNTFTVQPVAMRRVESVADLAEPAQTWSEAAAAASTGGTRAQWTARFEPTYGGAFRLAFTGVRGVSIRRVTVELMAQPAFGS